MHMFDQAVRIRTSQTELLGTVLATAFYNDPAVTYILPDAHTRRSVLSWFFTSVAIRTSRLCGDIYTNSNLDGAALWISPGAELTVRHAVRTELLSMPCKLDRSSATRWINVSRYLDSIRRQLADEVHWYLLALGTDPSITGIAVRKTLIAPCWRPQTGIFDRAMSKPFKKRISRFMNNVVFALSVPDEFRTEAQVFGRCSDRHNGWVKQRKGS